MRTAIHCPFCGELLVAINEADLFIVLRLHVDHLHIDQQIDDAELYEFIEVLELAII
jgi:hypothetical protein